MKKFLSVILSFVLVLGIVFSMPSLETDAASKKVKKKAAKAYRTWLYESDVTGFRLFDINKDGIKEMLTTYDGYGNNVYSIGVYTYKGGRVVNCNNYEYDYSMFGFSYNSKTKKMYGSRGGGGGVEKWQYNLTKSGKVKRVYLQQVEYGYNPSTGNAYFGYFYNGKEITKAQYNKKNSSWSKNLKPLKFYKISVKNIKKYVK